MKLSRISEPRGEVRDALPTDPNRLHAGRGANFAGDHAGGLERAVLPVGERDALRVEVLAHRTAVRPRPASRAKRTSAEEVVAACTLRSEALDAADFYVMDTASV
jgi:hypothetical protein